MEGEAYGFIKDFFKYEEIMDQCIEIADSQRIDRCDELTIENFDKFVFDVKSKCPQVILYLQKIYENNNMSSVGCKFLYYWVYNYLLQKKQINKIRTIYLTFLSTYSVTYSNHNLTDARKISIKEVDLPKVTALYDMYKNLKTIKQNCKPNKSEEYCSLVKEIINQYNMQLQKEDIEISATHVLPHYHSNIKAPILTTITVILMITFFIFIANKISPHVPFLHHGIKRIKNKLKNTVIEWNMLQSQGLRNSFLNTDRYSVFI
ncbi:variable surface protein [Plasmodium gonderi]|uniref:Variable surface protein n=1 Tax=Plasmodium gonderi TaxID=77519 RepID=A0A1Y1JN99_PLAGO|nr:variable surface protein [Plasmodium gonderi]GAW83941.1 variable surface protein [Plasmodium gonderi]